ncbi:MAG: hypothetical protein K0B02_02820 [DPANN group archaeon]|nr:hypothetical protein [DPANN group archaeon]
MPTYSTQPNKEEYCGLSIKTNEAGKEFNIYGGGIVGDINFNIAEKIKPTNINDKIQETKDIIHKILTK